MYFLLAILFLLFAVILNTKTKWKGIISVSFVIVVAIVTSYFAINALLFNPFSFSLGDLEIFGKFEIKIDSLSAFFILIINFTFLTGAFYGFDYMKKYKERASQISLHCVSYIIAHLSLIGICMMANGFFLLLLWELMAISQFILVIFENEKEETIKAGINYLIQSHVCIVFLMLGFIYVAFKTGSYSFDAISEFSAHQSTLAGTALFLCFFIGFAIKAGFVPFHTWLPYAHPAAPSHISGVMSGVVIKIGIYGILRMLLLIKTDYATIGYIILVISVITGVYGVMLATIQHDLKKLLAYHSIENIGIIGIGIGIGCIGLGDSNKWMAILGFSGAMLHTLNHSLFKSLLFYSAGNVLSSAHTVNIDDLGGIIKKMPRTAILFLIAAIAICGLPPLNGFISEFIIYGGIYNWLYSATLLSLITIVFALGGLVLIGGLAIMCFTKAFSVVFLGKGRNIETSKVTEVSKLRLFPMYMVALFMICIGLFPYFFIDILQKPVNLFTHHVVFNLNLIKVGVIDSLQLLNFIFIGFAVLIIVIFWLRSFISKRRLIESGTTWSCAYTTDIPKAQYTAGSYVKSYARLAKPVLEIEKTDEEIKEVFPVEKHYHTNSYDKIEKVFIDGPLRFVNKFFDRFLFLQNGQLQSYILYGIVFITAVLCLPMIAEKITFMIRFLNNL
jgi:hydrogenase-4 component B